jgi:hypothetical protein
MKLLKLILFLLVISIVLLSCSRDEPYVAPTTETPVDTVVVTTVNVVINEIGPNESPDWFELYNTTTASVDISGYKYVNVTKSADATKAYATYTFPSGTTIDAKGYLALNCDGTATTEREKLSSTNGEKLALYNSKDVLLDSVSFPAAIAVGSAYARVPDGGSWVLTTTQTKGASNK